MNFPFLNSRAKKRDQVMVVDLGGRTTKAVLMRRKGEGLSLMRYVIQDAPAYDRNVSPEVLAEHLRGIVQLLEPKIKNLVLTVGPGESILRSAELPLLPASDLRQMLLFDLSR